MSASDKRAYTPKIVTFCCMHSGYRAADLAGYERLSYPEGLRVIRVPCSGKVDALYILKAFERGADGVLILACNDDNCQFVYGNQRARRRVEYVRGTLKEIGLQPERVEIRNLSALDGEKFIGYVNELFERVETLGPVDQDRT